MENMEAEPTPPPPSSIPSTPEILPSSSSPSQNPNPNPNTQTPNFPPISTPSEPQPQLHQPQQLQQPQPQLHQPQQTQQTQPQLQQQQQPTFQQSQQRSPTLPPLPNKTRQPYPHFSQHLPSSSSPPISATPMQRTSGLAIGFPAHGNRPPQQHTGFGPSSFSHHLQQPQQQLGGLPRNSMIGQSQVSTNVNDQLPNSNTQARQAIQGIHNLGMMGSISAPQIRPSQPSRSQSLSNNQALASQKFQGPGMLRSNLGSTSSSSPATPQVSQPNQQPWLSAQGKQMHPSIPSPSYRQHLRPQGMQHRPQLSQQHQHPQSHQQQMPSSQQQHQQQSSQSYHSQEHGHQYPPPRMPQSASHQLQASRAPGSANQKPLTTTTVQPSIQSGSLTPMSTTNAIESGNQILSKRSIHELVAQIDPSERLNPEVEDILVEIADDFVESITTFACSLAKHRKSTTLEAKDILLHLERNWNMTLPGFGGEEIKSYKKPDSSRSLPRNKKLSL